MYKAKNVDTDKALKAIQQARDRCAVYCERSEK